MLDEMLATITRKLSENPIMKVEACPHCLQAAIAVESKKHKKYPYQVKCLNPFCGCKTERYNSLSGAVSAWNRRDVNAEEKV